MSFTNSLQGDVGAHFDQCRFYREKINDTNRILISQNVAKSQPLFMSFSIMLQGDSDARFDQL